MTTTTVTNNDNGSLKVGTSAGTHKWNVGDKLQIMSEGTKIRTVTYVMGAGEKCHLCFKGQGPIAIGELEYRIVES